MEKPRLTLEQIDHMPAVPREISSVRIREFDDSTANPEPIVQDEEADLLLEEFLSPSKLVCLTSLGYVIMNSCTFGWLDALLLSWQGNPLNLSL